MENLSKADSSEEGKSETSQSSVVSQLPSIQRSDSEPQTEEPGETSIEAVDVDIDQVFEILKNKRRRAVLRYMQTVEDEVRLGELAEQIAGWECDKDVSQISSSERKRVYVGLYQCHLPKMDDADVIDFDQSRGTVERRPAANQLYAYLAVDPTATTGADSTRASGEAGFREKLSMFFS
jgi:hypothetical protein